MVILHSLEAASLYEAVNLLDRTRQVSVDRRVAINVVEPYVGGIFYIERLLLARTPVVYFLPC